MTGWFLTKRATARPRGCMKNLVTSGASQSRRRTRSCVRSISARQPAWRVTRHCGRSGCRPDALGRQAISRKLRNLRAGPLEKNIAHAKARSSKGGCRCFFISSSRLRVVLWREDQENRSFVILKKRILRCFQWIGGADCPQYADAARRAQFTVVFEPARLGQSAPPCSPLMTLASAHYRTLPTGNIEEPWRVSERSDAQQTAADNWLPFRVQRLPQTVKPKIYFNPLARQLYAKLLAVR